MCGPDTETVSEANFIMRDPLKLPETLIAGRQKRAIKKNIKLETEYYEWADDHQGVSRYICNGVDSLGVAHKTLNNTKYFFSCLADKYVQLVLRPTPVMLINFMSLVSGKRGRGRPRKRPPFSGPNLSCSVLGCEMTSSVAASFDDEKSGKQRAAVFPFPEGDDNLALGKRYVESVLSFFLL